MMSGWIALPRCLENDALWSKPLAWRLVYLRILYLRNYSIEAPTPGLTPGQVRLSWAQDSAYLEGISRHEYNRCIDWLHDRRVLRVVTRTAKGTVYQLCQIGVEPGHRQPVASGPAHSPNAPSNPNARDAPVPEHYSINAVAEVY